MNNNIFELTEIAQQIASNLAPADLFNACRVCRTWFVPFASELWRCIKADQWIHGALSKALPRYSLYVRELHCSLYTPLEDLGEDCKMLTLFRAPELAPNNIQVIASILERNPDIEELWLISGMPWARIGLTMVLVQILSKMKKLKKLILHDFKVTTGTLSYLLRKLPQLKSLDVEGYEERNVSEYDATFSFDLFSPDQQLQHPGPNEPSQLQSLHMNGYQDSFESILKIARISPLLESLSLSDTSRYSIDLSILESMTPFCKQLSESCPCLNQLKLNQSSISMDGLSCLLSAFPKLKKFDVEGLDMVDTFLLRLILDHPEYSDTLEEIRIAPEGFFFRAPEALQILREFSKLRKLDLSDCVIAAEAMVSDAGMEGLMDGGFCEKYFKCQDLELLVVSILGPTNNWAPPSVLWNRHDSETENDYDEEEEGEEEGEKEDCRWKGYQLYSLVSKQLDSLPKLDWTRVRFML
ncbi:hypothetical protein BGZ49_009575 [Haplosporangium sp. Z 27]|nr:hypothetical protein BGZ49_009575 [Haplosporangium sp. Z 27]